MSKKYPAPAGLSKAANARWNDVVRRWDLRPDELSVLERACRTMDTITALEAVVEAEGLMTTGSMGQTVAHPALQEARQQSALLKSLWKSLKLPDEDSDSLAGISPSSLNATAGQRSAAARKAVQSRWASHHGAVA